MIQALSGFALIGVVVLVGWAAGRWAGLPDGAEAVLGRVVYAVMTPCLLFTGVASADLGVLLREPLLVSTAAAILCLGLHALLVRGRDPGTRIVGALAAGYTNANYIGIPVALYVLGDATLVVPVVMVQLLVITPIAMVLLQAATAGGVSPRATAAATLRNPLIIAVALGAVAAATGLRLPGVIADPIATIGSAAVPVVLIAYGMSLSGRRVLAAGSDRTAIVVAVLLKTTVMPALAFLLAVAAGLPRDAIFAVTVLAALPTAQNIFLYAQRFGAGLTVARDAIFLSTIACVPVLILITVLFTR